jgi:hypothetical protein
MHPKLCGVLNFLVESVIIGLRMGYTFLCVFGLAILNYHRNRKSPCVFFPSANQPRKKNLGNGERPRQLVLLLLGLQCLAWPARVCEEDGRDDIRLIAGLACLKSEDLSRLRSAGIHAQNEPVDAFFRPGTAPPKGGYPGIFVFVLCLITLSD